LRSSRRSSSPTAFDPADSPCTAAEPLHERLREQLAGAVLPSVPPIEALLARVSETYREHERVAARLTHERDEMKALLHRHEQRFRALTENALDIAAVVSPAGRIEYASPSIERVMGYTPAELVGKSILQLVHAEDAGGMRQELQRAAHRLPSEKTILVRFQHRNGSWRVLEIVGTNCREDPSVGGIVINCRDITERTLAQDRIHHLAHHDELTGLPNRNLFRDRAQQAMAQAERSQKRLALMFLDLDRFKHINDSLGHHVGDRLLQQMAERLAGSVRQMDTVARLGGDEFVIVLSDLQDVHDLAPLATKLLEIIAAPLQLEGNELNVSGSIGISVFPDDGGDLDTLMRNADTAMYHAKESGRNNFQYFTSRMNALAHERLVLETRLRRAIRQQEFVLHYQPVVSAMTGVIVGMEALVRWQDPERGLVPPAQFIRAAEDAGLINALGAWVLQEACRQNREWQDAGRFHLPVAVNLSAEQFRSRALLDTVSQALAQSRLEPRYLELEITETLLMEQSEQTLSLLARLNALGLQLSIDDFGTGYSSLSYLTRFPIHKLKIDKSFVRHIGADASDAAITSAVIALAHSLKLKVLAEGVETRLQLDFLRMRGCHELQGFLFSKPLPPAEFAQLVPRWEAGAYAAPIPADALHPFIAV
jgi:diguanylate cyclase (GGDEF)-like protein/PAS domain S-box-containing protein